MQDLFEHAWAKLVWSEHHRQQLAPLILEYVRQQPIELGRREDGEIDGGRRMRISWYVTKLDPIPQRWALMAGDAIQNARHALDHAVWALVVNSMGEQFAIDNHRQIQFPIVEPGAAFPREQVRRLGLSDLVLDVIEQQQADHQRPEAPDEDPLRVLRVLSNVDKHRLVHLVHLVASDARVATRPRLFNGRVIFPNPQELHVGDEAVRFEAVLPVEPFPIEFDLQITSDIVLGATPQTRPVAIEIGIRLMQGRVAEILDSLLAVA